MPSILPTPETGQPVKIVVFTNYRQWGWSDVFFYAASGGTAAQQWTDIAFATAELSRAIDFCHADGVFVVGARAAVLDVDNFRFVTGHQSNLFSRADMLIPDVAGVGPPESPWAAILFDLSMGDFSLDRRWLMRGWPAVAQQKQTAQGGFDPTLPAPVTAGMNRLRQRVFGPAGEAGTPPRQFAGKFCLKARDFRPTPSPRAAIQRIGSTANPGFFVIRVLDVDDWGVEVGDRVLVQGSRVECCRGPAGLATVTSIAEVVGTPASADWTLSTKWVSSGPPQVKTYGNVFRYAEGLFAISLINFERFVKRDTGRPFFGTAGRQSGRM